MVAYNKYDSFSKALIDGVHNFNTGQVFKTALSNTAQVFTTTGLAGVTELGTTGGYTAGGITVTVTTSTTGTAGSATAKATTTTNPLWTGSGGGFTFKFAILYNDTPTTPVADPLISFYDYGTSQAVGVGETLTVDYDDTNGIFTVV